MINKKVLFVGQALPKTDPGKPFGRTKLYQWFEMVGISQSFIDSFSFTAMANYFPGATNGSHKVPTPQEIEIEMPRLEQYFEEVNPDIVVPVGKLSIGYALQLDDVILEKVIGEKFLAAPYGFGARKRVIIPLPHPSGASSWYYKSENKELLTKALLLLKDCLQ